MRLLDIRREQIHAGRHADATLVPERACTLDLPGIVQLEVIDDREIEPLVLGRQANLHREPQDALVAAGDDLLDARRDRAALVGALVREVPKASDALVPDEWRRADRVFPARI